MMNPTLATFGRAVVDAAVRWRQNALECRRLLGELQPCEGIEDGDGPCWKLPWERIEHRPHYTDGVSYGVETVPPAHCDACVANEDGPLDALRKERARRGGLSSALARAVDKYLAEVGSDD